ncbi:MAG: LysR family transcriptional regulator [Oscillospiraceae bacterium]|nr:LysR family transcriptional regulator [Oscillospiraceae bacterium]
MINLELYKIFVIVANQKSITNASNILNISQPAVTKHIKNLENLLQTKLFERNNQGTTLTKTGQELYSKLKEPMNTIINIANQYNAVRTINLGSHYTILNKMLSKCFIKFYNQNTDVKINTINMETDKMMDMLTLNELDIVVSKQVDESLCGSKIEYIKLRNI